MSVVTVRVDEKLRKRMSRVKGTNWSEIIRQAIEQTIDQKTGANPALALLLNERNTIVPERRYKSTEFIKRWRSGARWKQS